jgi:eukaryotic-like serine/threonine-protein kinase
MAVNRTLPPPRTIRFGPFELDVRTAELRKHDIRIRLNEQPFRILLMLVEHAGDVVLRDDIRLALWPNNTVVEFDHSINAAIQRLRDALGDSASNPRYVETVARRGYRFIGTLEPEAAAPQDRTPAVPAAPPPPRVDPSDLSGQTFGHFRVIAKLGSGGMGVVYRAEDLKLGRHVALKFLPLPAHEAPPGLLDRFRREARAASALNHPNICTIYGVDKFAGQPLIVMELLEGETLEARLAKGALAVEKSLPLALQLAAALDAAHRKGIVHRDLKPANIMLTKSGLKVLDFGLAKVERAIAGEVETFTEVTQAGTILGTWQYMSPEQAQGKDADARSDLFSFGCILLEMLTGQRAFTGASPADLISAILTEDPLESAPLATPLPPALASVIHHCLEKNLENRFQTARDLAFALEALSVGSAAPAPASAPAVAGPRKRDWRATAAAVLALVAIAGAWWAGGRPLSGQPVKFERLTFRRGFVQGARFVPGGQSLIYAASFEGQPIELFWMQPGRPESTRSLGFPATGLLSIAPNGEMAVSSNCVLNIWGDCRGTLARMPLAGGAPREVLENVKSADWTPDGKQLVVTMAAADGKPSRLEFPVGKVLFEATRNGWPGDPRISPQGDLIAFADHSTYGSDGSVAVVDLRGRKRSLTRTFNDVAGLAWSPSGKEIWFTASDNNMAPIYAVTLSGDMRMVAQMPGDLRLLDIAHDGRLLLTRNDARLGAYFLDTAESRSRELTLLNWAAGGIVSPDGKRILLSESGQGTGGKTVLYLRPTDGSPAVRLGDNLTGESLSPDGQWAIALTYNQGSPHRVLVPLKAGAPVVIDNGPLEFVGGGWNGTPHVGWFPDSRRILFRAKEPGRLARTFAQDIHGGRPLPVTSEGISGTVLTVDGTTLLAWDEESNAFLYPLSGGTPKPLPFLTREYNAITFSSDGRSLYVTRRNEMPPKVWRVDLANGRIVLWRELPFIDPAGTTSVIIERITPDGKWMAYSVFRSLTELYLAEGLK